MLVDEEQLTQYALGILDEGEQKAIEREIATSFELQKELVVISNSLQNIAFAETPLLPSDSLRDLVLQSINKKTRFDGFIERFADLFDLDNLTSQSLLKKIDHTANRAWESTLLPGVKIMKFPGGPRVSAATCGIVQVKPGKFFPAHQHQGNELILVLQGRALDDNASVLAAGDRFNFDTGSSHSFRIIGDETFVFAVVLHKENKWLWIKSLIDLLHIKKR